MKCSEGKRRLKFTKRLQGALKVSFYICPENRNCGRWNEYISRSKQPNPVAQMHKPYTYIHNTCVGIPSWLQNASRCALRQSELENRGALRQNMAISENKDVQMRFSRRFFARNPKYNHQESNQMFTWAERGMGVAQTAPKENGPDRLWQKAACPATRSILTRRLRGVSISPLAQVNMQASRLSVAVARDGSAAIVSIMYLICLKYLYKEIVYPQRVHVRKGI